MHKAIFCCQMGAKYSYKGLIIFCSEFLCFPLFFSSLLISLYFQDFFVSPLYLISFKNHLLKNNKKRNWIFFFSWNCFCSKIFWEIVSGKYALACNSEVFYGIIIKASIQIHTYIIDRYIKIF